MSSKKREKTIVKWLSSIQHNVEELYLVGDIFDYWYEYKMVIPKGFSRLLGKLAEMSDQGVKIYFFTGNHDMWMFRYLSEEMNIPIYRRPIIRKIKGKTFFIGHGDGLGPGDHGYKMLKKIMANPFCQWAYARIHPNLGIKIMQYFSRKSRAAEVEDVAFMGKEKEWLIAFSEEHSKENDIDYYVFGHRHLLLRYSLSNGNSTYFNIGDWLTYQSYLIFDGNKAELKTYNTNYTPMIV